MESDALIAEAVAASKVPGGIPSALALAKTAVLKAVRLPDMAARARALSAQGEFHLQLSSPHLALPLFQDAKRLDPTLLPADVGLAAALAGTGDAAGAAAILEAHGGAAPPTTLGATEIMLLGRAWMALGNAEVGEKLLTSAWAKGAGADASFEIGLAHEMRYTAARTEQAVGEAVEGYKDAVEAYKKCARQNRKDLRAKFKLGLLAEERYHHRIMFGVTHGSKAEGEGDSCKDAALIDATWSACSMEDEILAIGNMHGLFGTPTIEELLGALIEEHRDLVNIGQRAKSDVIMELYHFKSRQLLGKNSKVKVQVDADLKAAAAEYDEAVKADKSCGAGVYLHLARVQLLMGKPDAASKTAKAAALAYPGDPVVLMLAPLCEPLDEAAAECPPALLEHAPAVLRCVEEAVAIGPAPPKGLLGEELWHATNPALVRAAIACSRGLYSKGDHEGAERLAAGLVGVLPGARGHLGRGVLGFELERLLAAARGAWLDALVGRGAVAEAWPLYEQVYEHLKEAAGSRAGAADADATLVALVKVCQQGVALRPDWGPAKTRLAAAKFQAVERDPSFDKPSRKAEKDAAVAEVEALLRECLKLEGCPAKGVPAAAAAHVLGQHAHSPLPRLPPLGSISPAEDVNPRSAAARVELCKVLREVAMSAGMSEETRAEVVQLYREVREMDARCVDAYVGVGEVLFATEPMAAIEEMASFPDPEGAPGFDDSFVHVEVVRRVIAHAEATKDKSLYDLPALEKSFVLAGKVMGWGGMESYMTKLDNKGRWDMLKRVYVQIQGLEEESDEVQGYFKAMGWD